MSNPYDPSQPDHQQQWGQSPNPQQPVQGYDAGPAQGAPQPPPYGQDQQWGAPQPAQIDWNSAPPQADQAPWRGPAAFAPPAPAPAGQAPPAPEPQQFAPPAGHDQPWVSGGSAQTAQEVADQWQSSQQAPVADYQAPQQQAAPQQQWPSYDAPAQHQDTSINEAATVTTPAVQEPAAEQEPEALTIGRGRENSIVLDDMLVSRHHVRITADSDGLILEDLGSRNGTYVNGRRVERTHLSEGDRIGIGAATFEVRDGWLLNV